MYISLNWIKEFVDLGGLSQEEIIKRLTLSTAEIEGVEVKGAGIENVVVAEIVETKRLENTNHLNIMKVDDGSGKLVQIVTGAPNVYNGMRTFLVRVGGQVNGYKIKAAKLAGHDSFGMCCSETELGIGTDDEGIVDYRGDVPNGTDIKTILPIEDTIIEVDNKSLTNRPDLWSHYGFAREIAAIFGRKLKPLKLQKLDEFSKLPALPLEVKTDACLRYSSIAVGNITQKLSPEYIKIRLNYCGLRDINLLTDITNYLMLEVGQPMHAFDHEIVGGIKVLEAGKNQKLLTLEGEEHDIPKGSVLICDNKGESVAIAGVKGGKLSGITEKTNSLLLESAVFDSVKIRSTVKEIGLSTDASIRYEKSLDPENTTIAIARLLYILKQIDPKIKVLSSLTDDYRYKYPKIKISVTPEFINSRGGVDLSKAKIVQILKSLEFEVEEKAGELVVVPPSFRATKDVAIREDLVEEVLRMYGYDNIVPKSILSKVEPIEISKVHTAEYKTKRLLAEKYGASEVHSYVWSYADFNKQVGIDSPVFVSLSDSAHSGQSGIRSELAPTMLKVFAENKNYFEDIVIDEIGRVVVGVDKDNRSIEKNKLAVLVASTTKSEKDIYFELKKMIINIAESLVGAKLELTDFVKRPPYIHPINSVGIKTNAKEVGWFGVLHPTVRSKVDKKFAIGLIEVDFDLFVASKPQEKKFRPISKFQPVHLDFNFVVPNSKSYADIEKAILSFRSKFETKHKLIDIYENKELFGDGRSMTFSFEISSFEHTLTANEIDTFQFRMIDHMKRQGIELRK